MGKIEADGVQKLKNGFYMKELRKLQTGAIFRIG
jgi:hypothetical protein